jgi:hypothetical protein
MCKDYKDNICLVHKSVKEATNKGYSSSNDNNETRRDRAYKDKVNNRKNYSRAQFKINYIKNYLDKDFVFNRDLKGQICKIKIANKIEL